MADRITRDQQLLERLHRGVAALGVSLGPEQSEQLIEYLHLLRRWNQAYNLTAVKSVEDMIPIHLLDSLSVATFIQGPRVLDVGTGAGLPGIPLAIAHPAVRFSLLDSNGKKVRFIRQVVIELGLANVEPVQARLEAYKPDQPFDQVVSRAFTSLEGYLHAARRLCRAGGQLLSMKGRVDVDELSRIEPVCTHRVERLMVPQLDAERHLVMISI